MLLNIVKSGEQDKEHSKVGENGPCTCFNIDKLNPLPDNKI